MSVLNNIGALTGVRQLGMTQAGLNDTIQRLTTTKRINKASDDAAGLSIAVKLGADVKISAQGQRNAQDGLRFLGVADGALDEVINLLTRGSTLAEQARTGTVDATGRSALDAEYQKISSTVNEIMNNTKFNGAKVFGTGATTTTPPTTISGAGSMINTMWSSPTNTWSNGWAAVATVANYFNDGTIWNYDPAISSIVSDADATKDWYITNGTSGSDESAAVLTQLQAFLQAHPTDINAASLLAMTEYVIAHPPASGSGDDANGDATTAASGNTVTIPGTGGTTTSGSVSIAIGNYTTVTLNTDPTGIPGNLGNLLTSSAADSARTALDSARTAVSKLRGSLGADMAYLSGVSNALGIGMENTTAAYSQIMDADIAQEVVSLTKFQVLNQSGTSALGQANQGSQSVLSLLR